MCVVVLYLRPEGGPGTGRADGSMAGEGDGQTSGPVLAGLVLAHQPALRKQQVERVRTTCLYITVHSSYIILTDSQNSAFKLYPC